MTPEMLAEPATREATTEFAPRAARPAVPGAGPAAPLEGEARPSAAPTYRSVADGELKTPWTLGDYFASLNTVLRLPTRARRKLEEAVRRYPDDVAAATAIGARVASLPFRPLIMVGGLVAVLVMGVQGLGTPAGGKGSVDLTPALGAWVAENGSYAGRSFELDRERIGFRSGSVTTPLAWHPVTAVRGNALADSTLYTVIYEEQGRESEFSFWYVGGARPVVRLKNKPGVAWHRPGSAPARPRS